MFYLNLEFNIPEEFQDNKHEFLKEIKKLLDYVENEFEQDSRKHKYDDSFGILIIRYKSSDYGELACMATNLHSISKDLQRIYLCNRPNAIKQIPSIAGNCILLWETKKKLIPICKY